MGYRGIILSHETVRFWCYKFAVYFQDVIRKSEWKPTDKWHLDEMMNIKIKGEVFILWRAVDSEGNELEVLMQKRRNKKSAIRFLSRLLGNYPDRLCLEGYLLVFFRRNYPILTGTHLPNEFHKFIILVITIASRFCDDIFLVNR